jgi:hypothetical protein
MPLVATTITIDGTAHPDTGWGSSGLVVDSWGWDYDSDDECEFHEEGPALAHAYPTFKGGQSVSLTAGGTAVFTGEITSVEPSTRDGWTFAYRAKGQKYRGNKVWTTGSDGTGSIVLNAPNTDPAYVPSLAGQTVAQILTYVLGLHATALGSLSIQTDSTTTTQLGAITALGVVPSQTVYLTGRLFVALDGLLRQWARNVVLWVGPDGNIRFIDTTSAGTTLTLTEGTDPLLPFRFAYDLSDTATRVVVRGGGDIRPAMLKMSQTYASGTEHYLKWAQTSGEESAWNEKSFTNPKNAFDSGTVVTTVDPNTVTLNSSDATQTVPAHFWGSRQAWLHLFNDGGTGITFQESVPVTDNTAEAPAGNFNVSLGVALQNAGASAYQTYNLVGGAAPLGTGASDSLVDVWRLITVNDPGGLISGHLVPYFPQPVGWIGYYGDSVVGTTVPTGIVINAQGESVPFDFDIVPQTGQIRARRPTVEATTSAQNLALGGSHVTAPSDIYVLLAYSRGPLEAVYPPDSGGSPVYSGTAHDLLGFDRTMYIDVPEWIYVGTNSNMLALATMHHAAVCDVPWTGTVPLLAPLPAAYTPKTSGTPDVYGLTLNVPGNGYTTGGESLAVPIRGYRLTYVSDGQGGILYKSAIRCSAKRNPATGDRNYVHPVTLEQLSFKLPMEGYLNVAGAGFGAGAGRIGTPQLVGVTAADLAAQAITPQALNPWGGT